MGLTLSHLNGVHYKGVLPVFARVYECVFFLHGTKVQDVLIPRLSPEPPVEDLCVVLAWFQAEAFLRCTCHPCRS